MVVGASDGQGWRYEVVERSEGFVVRTRDLETGSVDDEDSQLFRTAAVAFAYAALSASFDRFAAARDAGDEPDEPIAEIEARQVLYDDLRRRLSDEAITAGVLIAWDEAEETALRRRHH